VTLPPEPISFRAAIIESFPAYPPNGTLAWNTLVKHANCSDAQSPLECLRTLPSSTIKDISEHNALRFNPVADNITFAADARPYFEQNKAAHVPIMIGSNADEGSIFAWVAGQDDPSINVTKTVQEYYPGQGSQQQAILEAYSADLNNPFAFFTRYDGDTTFQCPFAAFTDLLIDSNYTAWRYFYNATFPNLNVFPRSGVYHFSEVPIVFGTFPGENATQTERELSAYMQKTWAHFAKSPHAGPGWVELGGGQRDMEVIGNGRNDLTQHMASREEVDDVCKIYPYLMNGPL
jgi:carboxylesterase type B